MKKLLCALLSVMMVVTMMPVIAFAEDSVQTGPGQLYWAAVPENADPGTVPSDITWMDNNHPVSMETNGTLFVYFGIDVDGTITPLTAALLNYNTGGGVEVSECDGYIYKLTSASGSAQTWIQYVTETQDYEIGAIVNGGNSGGHNTEEKWAMIFSDVVIDGGNTPSKMSDIATGVRISGASSSANYYLYLVKFDDSDNIQEIEEVTTTRFEIKYLRGNPDHIDGTGLEIIKADDGIDGTENYYRFLTDKSLQADYDIGEGMYDVWPRAEGDNRLIYNSWIDTSESNTGGSDRPTEPYDIFVLSSRADLASLTEEQIKNEDDFAIIEASLTHENRTFTGYAYVATREYVNERWVYTGFRTPKENEYIYADYSAGNDQWVDSVNGTVTGLTWCKNTDGTYTFTHHGENTDEVRVNGESTYGYSVGLYENVPEGIYYTCECMPLQFTFMETATVTDGEYDLSMELLRDPSEIKDWPYETDRMCVNGQGNVMIFNTKITSWYSCFYVRNQANDYDARYTPSQDTNEVRTYVGAEGEYVIEARAKDSSDAWVSVDTLAEENQVFGIGYIGAKKGFYPVFQVKFDAKKDDTSKATDKFDFRLRYTGDDQYLDNGNENNCRMIELVRDENLDEFDIDEYWFNEVYQDWNTGNVLHFDFIGTTIRTKLNIRPGVLQSVADKTWYDKDDYIFIENEVDNIQFYRYEEKPDGKTELIQLKDEESPFTVTWDDINKEYKITYDHPERDLYGPHYQMQYTGDYNTKINAAYGYEEGTEHKVHNASAIITGKLTVAVDKVDQNGVIDATTEDEILGTEVILGEDAVGDRTELEINTNDGSITLGGALVGNIKIKNGKVHFKMWNVKEEKYFLNDTQKETVSKCDKAFDFKIDAEDADIEFGEDGYAKIRIPYDRDEGYIYYITEKGEKEYIDCICKDGYIEFTAKHFSIYAVSEDTPDLSGGEGEEGGETPGGSGSGGHSGGGGGSYIPVTPATPDPLPPAKSAASEAVNSYVDMAEYETAEAEEIAAIIEQAKKNIEAAKTVEEIKAIEEAAKAELDKLETAEEKELIAEVEEIKFKACSKMTTLKGKTAIKVSWNTPEGMEFDGFDVFRSTKKNKGYGKKPFFTTTRNSYTNSKNLKSGKTYYYKVRAFKYVNDEKVYTQWSYKAWRTVK